MRRVRPPRPAVLVGAVLFVDTALIAIVAPLLPHYVDHLSISKTGAGVLLGAYAAGTLLGAIPSGRIAARVGGRASVALGLTTIAAASLVFATSESFLPLVLARSAQGVGGACTFAGGLAWLLAGRDPSERAGLIGAVLGAAIAGSLFGPVLGAAAGVVGHRAVFGALAVVALVLFALLAASPAGLADATAETSMVSAVTAADVGFALWLVALPAMGFGAVHVLTTLRLDALGATRGHIALAFFVAAACEALASVVSGRLADRLGPRVPLRVGLASSAILLVGLPHADSWLLAAVGLVSVTALLGTSWTPAMAWVAHGVERAGVAAAVGFALVNLAWAVGQLAGSSGGAALAKATSDAVPFSAPAIGCLVSTAGLSARRTTAPPASG